MIAKRGDQLLLVVNAACEADDEAHLRASLSDSCEVEVLADRALLALQGPQAEAVLGRLDPKAAAMRFMDVADLVLAGLACVLSSPGYTGEGGFAIRLPAADAAGVAAAPLADDRVIPPGLCGRPRRGLDAGQGP